MEKDQQRLLQRELISIINEHFSGENERLAFILKRLGKSVSVRAVQSWLIDPDRRSSRKLPDWVLPMLREYTSHVDGASFDEKIQQRNGHAHLTKIIDRDAVAMADRQIERALAIRDKWEKASFANIPKLMADLELRMDQQDEYFGMLSDSIGEAFAECDDYDSFKQIFKSRRELRFKILNEVRQIRHAIENKLDVFSDKLPEQTSRSGNLKHSN